MQVCLLRLDDEEGRKEAKGPPARARAHTRALRAPHPHLAETFTIEYTSTKHPSLLPAYSHLPSEPATVMRQVQLPLQSPLQLPLPLQI